jgi:predicted membrane-bound spermidine synthase
MRTRISVFLIALSGLVLEVGLTRIYSASVWYHFAFVAISVALLGWGLGGFTVHLLKQKKQLSLNTAAIISALYAVTVPLCLWVLHSFPFEMARLPLYFLTPLLPFFLAGMALSIVFDLHRSVAGTLYFADLLGAAIGAVLVTFLLHWLGGEPALLTGAIAPAIAALCLLEKPGKPDEQSKPAPLIRIGLIVVLLLMGGLAVSAFKFGILRVTPGTTKAMRNQMDASPGSRITQTGWNAYSRIDAVEGVERKGNLARLYIDSDAWTGIREWDGRIESASDLRDSYRALPFRLTPNAETLIIGPGGGPDVVAALASGSRKVTAVEMNPLMLQFVRNYGPSAGNLYDRPDVEAILSEGRNFVSRSDKKFDIILLGFVDSWASVASGGLSLSENYLYTVEAFRAYYDHLSDNGILVILRWDSDIPRLVSNSVANLGAAAASQRIVTLLEKQATPDQPAQMLFMLRKRPFTTAETEEIKKWNQAERIILPGEPTRGLIGDVLTGNKNLTQYEASSPRFVGPVWDDSPFYFAIDRPFRMPAAIADSLLRWLLGPTMGMLALFAVFGRPRQASVGQYASSLTYFAALGFGFIAIELALLQNLTLLVGHPIFTLSVLLFTLLAMGGIGSALSWRVSMWVACLAVAVIGGIEAIALPRLVPALLWLPLWARIVCAIVMIAPLGLVMGMPFPSGLRQTGTGSLPAPPFYWGLNGIMSVIGSITTVFVALMAGFQAAMLIGSACYVLAALASRRAFQEGAAYEGRSDHYPQIAQITPI